MTLAQEEELFYDLSGYMDKEDAIRISSKAGVISKKYALSQLQGFQQSCLKQPDLKIKMSVVARMVDIRITEIKDNLISDL